MKTFPKDKIWTHRESNTGNARGRNQIVIFPQMESQVECCSEQQMGTFSFISKGKNTLSENSIA